MTTGDRKFASETSEIALALLTDSKRLIDDLCGTDPGISHIFALGFERLLVGPKVGRAAQVVVVSSVMFTFISYWRTAAIVLCDMSSTAYYIGAIVESAIGKAAPWFILAVLLFSYGMRAVYIESCSLFVRGGVYRIVKEALGGFLREGRGFGAAVRLRADRPDQRRFGGAVHRRV